MQLKNRDIIIVGLQPYDLGIGSNCINIATQFARFNRVLYVNYPIDRNTFKTKTVKEFHKKRIDIVNSSKHNLIKIDTNFYNLYPAIKIESINWLPSTFLFSIFNFINNARFAQQIKKAIKELDFKNYLVFNDSDMFRSFYLKELLKPVCYIYYSRDNLMSIPYWKKHGKLLEPKLINKSDLVCANSTYLTRIASSYNKQSYYVGQGCDITEFNTTTSYQIPNDIAHIKQPIIGYIGVLKTLRLDIEIITYLAQKKYNIVLIGPEDDDFKNSVLHSMPNVYFLGLKTTNELPCYLNYFDVAINPQILNETTIGNYPRKIDEYLAMGKPVVATKTEAMDIFKNHVYLANNKEEFANYIDMALKENNETKTNQRIEFAKSHTWENSVQEIYNAIHQVKPELF